MAVVKIRPRRSTPAEWEYDNPVLAEGEMGVETPITGVGTGYVKVKFGDGVTAWNDLPYGIIGESGGSAGEVATLKEQVEELKATVEELKAIVVVTQQSNS